jgi:DNA replication protein DnaC
MAETTAPLCLEICGQKDGKPTFCSRLEGHGGDHDPEASERAEAAAGEFAEQAGPRVVEDGVVEIRLSCESCGDERVIEVPDTAMSRKAAETMRARGVRCEVCADIAERAAGEVTQSEVVENRRASSGLPPKWQRQTFGGIEQDEERARALELAAQWSLEDIRGLVLWGEVGRGKTAIAAAAANGLLEKRRVRWLSVSELLMALRSGFGTPQYERALRQLDTGRGGAGLAGLALDDLDKLKPSEHQVQPIFTAVNAWVEAEAPLLVTLNRDLDALFEWLPETFAEPLCSRLAGYCKVVKVGGRDRRLEP